MPLPNKSQISDAVESVSSFLAPQLAGYSTENGILGPDHYSGGFCIVFPIQNGSKRKALRVWHTEIEKIKERYKHISNDIAVSKKQFLLNVEYISKGLLVGSEKIDVVLMDWLNGQSLKQYMSEIIGSSDSSRAKSKKLNLLADKLYGMFNEMHSLHFAHGDLQHDNIIISPSGDIQLIDYDNFYTPSLGTSMRQTTTGYSGYQHPIRLLLSKVNSSEKDDYFAELIIYLSIKAIAENLSLWNIAKDDDYALLLTNEDYKDIHNSATYAKIKQIGGELEFPCMILEEYLSKTSLSDLEPFDILLERLTKDPVIKKFSASCGKKTLNGKSIVLSWDVENYTQILLDGKDVTTQISNTLTINTSTTYTLTVINGHKRTSKSIMISSYSSPSVSVTASKTKLHKGRNESVTINWGVQNAEKITLLQDGVPIDKKFGQDDSYKCSIKDTTTFTVQALALDGKTTFSDSVTVEVHPDAKFKFESDKEYAFPTIPFTLSWTTKHAKRVELNGKKVAYNGTEIIKKGVDKDTTYTLAVTDEFGTKESSITIKMLPVPRINALLVPTPDIQQTITMNVDLKLPNITVSSLDTQLQEVELIGASLYNTELEAIETPQFIDLQYKLKTPTLWQKIEKSIAKLLHKNENR